MRQTPTQFWHVTPLHYVPHLFATGVLYAQDALRARELSIRPRATAEKRDRKLRLSRYVHLSFEAVTPLLVDKCGRGYRHALIAFDAALADATGAALVAYNSKAWRHREDFLPIYNPAAKAALLAEWRRGRYPSAELLIEDALPLDPHGVALHLASEAEAEWLRGVIADLGLPCPLAIAVSPTLFPPGPGPGPDLGAHTAYAEACRAAARLLPPPDLPFD